MKFLDELNETNQMGKKAYNISLLKKIGISVPDGFVIEANDNIHELKVIIESSIDKIGGFPVAVRSSGQLEDLEGASFAGLYETYLNVNSIDEVLNAIIKCRESVHSNRVKSYLADKKIVIDDKDIESCFFVFIQKMIDPQYSGVLFAIDPLLGKEEELYLETCAGLGERLVSGEVGPSQYRFNYRQKRITYFQKGSDDVELDESHLKNLAEISLKSSSYFKLPQDIEFCIDRDNHVWIVQSRPITKFSPRFDYGELTNADLKDGGVSSQSCTALMFSLYEYCMDISLPQYFRDIRLLKTNFKATYMFYGRVYWSSGEVKKLLTSMPGFNEESFDLDLGIHKDYGEVGPIKTSLNLNSIILGLKTLYFINKEFKNSLQKVEKFQREFNDLDNRYRDIIASELSVEVLNDFFFNFYIPTETTYFRTIYNNSNFQSLFKDELKGVEKKLNIKIDVVKLMSSIGSIGHLEVADDLKNLKKILLTKGRESEEFKKLYHQFLDKHYHHGDRELDLTVARWGEIPGKLDQLLESYILRECESVSTNYYQEELLRIENACKRKIFGKRAFLKLKSKIEKMRTFLEYREKMRTLSTRSYFLVRKLILRLGNDFEKDGILKSKDDIFNLKFLEIIEVFKAQKLDASLASELEYRKVFFNIFKDSWVPNDFGHKRIQEIDDNSPHIKGIPCSNGIVIGRALVLDDIANEHLINVGDILVTKFTDPGWTPILGKVNAVVTEVGGILSHAAVISREYGIPAVLNCGDKIKNIKTGMLIKVNGDNGIVEILDE